MFCTQSFFNRFVLHVDVPHNFIINRIHKVKHTQHFVQASQLRNSTARNGLKQLAHKPICGWINLKNIVYTVHQSMCHVLFFIGYAFNQWATKGISL